MHTIVEKENREKIYQQIQNKKITSFSCSSVTTNDLYQLFFTKLKKLIEKRDIEKARLLISLNKSRIESNGDSQSKSNLLNNLGCLNLLEGHFPKAVESFTEALTYQPDNEIPKSNLAVTYLKLLDYGNCQRMHATLSYDFDKVKYTSIKIQLPETFPLIDEEINNMEDDLKSNSTILHTLALVFLQNKNYARADYYLNQLIKSNKDQNESSINREYQLLKEYLFLFRDDKIVKESKATADQSINKLELFFSLMQNKNQGIISATGTLEEKEATQKILSTEKDILLDISALLTIHLIGADHFMANISQKIFITPLTTELIKNKISALEQDNPSELIQSFKSDHLEWQNIQLVYLANNIFFYQRILTWINSYCEILNWENIQLELFANEKTNYQKEYDELTAETLLTAKAYDLTLYCDDLKLRDIAHKEVGVKSFWTQIFLEDQCNKKELSTLDFHDFCISLCAYNYQDTIISNLMIIRALENAKFKIAEPFLSICDHIKSISLHDNEGIDSTLITLATIWNLHIHPQLKREIITHIVSVVTKDKIAYMIIDKFITILDYQKRDEQKGLIALLKELK